MSELETSPPLYHILRHTPGSNWQPGAAFHRQPGIAHHAEYMQEYLDAGALIMGGPFMDNSGGMMVFQGVSQEEAEQIAQDDPTVKSGLLDVTVIPWLIILAPEE